MNDRIRELAEQAGITTNIDTDYFQRDMNKWVDYFSEKFAELIVQECINREKLLGAIARGWCHKNNAHKTMDSDLAIAIFDEVEKQIKSNFEVIANSTITFGAEQMAGDGGYEVSTQEKYQAFVKKRNGE